MGEKEILVFTLGSSSLGLSIEETLGKRDRNGKSACWELLEHHRLVLSLEESQLQRGQFNAWSAFLLEIFGRLESLSHSFSLIHWGRETQVGGWNPEGSFYETTMNQKESNPWGHGPPSLISILRN